MKISESVTVACQAICMQKFGLSVALFQMKTLSYIHHLMLLFICSICQTMKYCHLLYLQRSWKRKSFVKEMQLQEDRISFYKEMLLVTKAESFLLFCVFSHSFHHLSHFTMHLGVDTMWLRLFMCIFLLVCLAVNKTVV